MPWTPLTCRCIKEKHVYTFDPPKESGSADDVGTGRNEPMTPRTFSQSGYGQPDGHGRLAARDGHPLRGAIRAWRLDSFDCLNEKTDPEGAHTSREFMQWLDAEHYILFARAFGYVDEAARETVCDYEDYQRAACRCAVLCWDAGYFQVYCKDEAVLEALRADAELRAMCGQVRICHRRERRTDDVLYLRRFFPSRS